jgi:di/tricarboxylate transporter
VLTIVIVAVVLARPLHLEPATIAMSGAAVLMLLDNWARHSEKAAKNIHQTFGDVEWITIFFFIGLFIVVHGVDVGGLLSLLANKLVAATGGNMAHAGYAILWASAFLSAIVDNIPFGGGIFEPPRSLQLSGHANVDQHGSTGLARSATNDKGLRCMHAAGIRFGACQPVDSPSVC